jgi:hypothetical protein
MIDQSHIDKPKIEAMIQTAVTAQELYVKAAAVDYEKQPSRLRTIRPNPRRTRKHRRTEHPDNPFAHRKITVRQSGKAIFYRQLRRGD